MTPAERLASLLGRWRVLRAIRHADGTRARFRGEATWRPDGTGLACVEAGMLEQGGARFPARRETLWRAGPAGIVVTFADDRPFHVIAGAGAHHDCPPDSYRLDYDFSARGFWSVRWRVTGPRKDYRAFTRHVRL